MTTAETKANIKVEEPIFIVACPRSGTTILATLLNNHSKIASATETHFFNYVSSQKKYKWKDFDLAQLTEFLDESRINDFFTVAKLSKEDFISSFEEDFKIHRDAEENKKQVFNLMMQELCKAKGKERFCEKTPQHLQNVKKILSIYPKAKIINLIRDGRDTVNSLIKMPWRPEGLINNSRFWKKYISYGLKAQDEFEKSFPESFITVRYEDLLKNPAETMQEITSFVGVDFEEAVTKPSGIKTDDANIFSDWETSWKHKSLEEIDSTRISAWQKELSDQDQLILNWHQKKVLESLGYESTEETKLSFPDMLRVAQEYASIFFKKLLRLVSFMVN